MTAATELAAIASTQLLQGVRVVELSRHVAGAYCGRILAQLGAFVVRAGPPIDAAASERTRAALQHVLHRGKGPLALDDPGLGQALATAQIVIVEKDDHDDAYARAVAQILHARAGLGDTAIVVVLSACGDGGGYPPGCALTGSADAAMSWAIGEPSREPLTPPYDIVDHEAGASAAAAALVALLADAGASASPVDVASRDVIAHFVSMLAQNYLPYARPWQRDGRRPFMSGGVYPLGLFTCKDGYVALYCRSDREWHSILKAMGDPPWSKEERFRDPRVIARHHLEEADTYLLPWLASHTKTEIMQFGLELGFPAAPVRFPQEALEDPQFRFRGSLQPATIDGGATVMVPSEPWRLAEVPQPDAATPARRWPLAASPSPSPATFLEGLRVLDLSWVWSGPLVNSILADLGADVIKVEHPSRLDSVRTRGRPWRDGKEVEGPVAELNPWFNQLNHGKRSVMLDMKSAEGRAQVLALAATCDVVVENMRPGALAKLGLGYTDFQAANPAVVMLSMSLAGQAGPLSHMKGYAGIMTSMAGLESLVGYDEPDGSQMVVGMAKTALGDPNAATHAMCVLMAALHRRRLTGKGLWIDLSQTDAILSILSGPLIESQLYGEARVQGNRHPLYAPHGHFACKDGKTWVAISIRTEAQWAKLLAATRDDALSLHARLDGAARVEQRGAVEQALEAWTSRRSADEIVTRLSAAGIAVAPVASYQDMSVSAWRSRRALTRIVDHPYIGQQEVVVPPWRYAGRTAGIARPAPVLGADTDEVLTELASLTSGRG
jgi:crotonobetainyl-CoA:carnitine CoA-transferase CaiB-like acyl-CoA transferase